MIDRNSDIIKYCPQCSGVARIEDRKKIVCDACGFQLYFNTAAACAALIFDGEGRLMVVRRNHEPRKGYLDLPGGFVDFGETGEEAVAREVREELGIELSECVYFKSIPNNYLYRGILYRTLDLFFKCRAGDLSAIQYNDEIAEIQFRHPRDIAEDEFAFDSMKKLLSYLKA